MHRNAYIPIVIVGLSLAFSAGSVSAAATNRKASFDLNWKFNLGDITGAEKPDFVDAGWRGLDLPHDWMIEGPPGIDPAKMEGPFDPNSPGGAGNGYLDGGVGWYRKTFTIPSADQGKHIAIDFDGVYMNSHVWINGHDLGIHPYGYTSFEYDLTPYLRFGTDSNIISVRAEVVQPCSRFYSGAGIYRHVWLVTTDPVHVAHWGTYVTAKADENSAAVTIQSTVVNDSQAAATVSLQTTVLDPDGNPAGSIAMDGITLAAGKSQAFSPEIKFDHAQRWSIETPTLYRAVTEVKKDGQVIDRYETPFGIRSIQFTIDNGFLLNGKRVQIQGVCDHHDLGCLGAAVNRRAIQRQLEILKSFGVNAIRTSHYPPAPELLDLADQMGFVVMDEAFDEWKHNKTKFGYGQFFDDWSERDILSMVDRDRNHPSIILWSIGNEIREQDEHNASEMSSRLAGFVRNEDPTRPIISAMSNPNASVKTGFSKALDVFGVNYGTKFYDDPRVHGVVPMMGSETSSSLSSRGEYELRPDKTGKLVPRKQFDHQVSDYDIDATGWGLTGHDGLAMMKSHPWMAGEFVWTGFDYLGEPTPYEWPSRSSYFGIVDLCGFPKDRYYLYQSQWTDKPVVHLLPNWNWEQMAGKPIPVWCFANTDSVELFLNGRSLGEKSASDFKSMHLEWSVPFEPGILKAVGRKNGTIVATDEVHTAGRPAKIVLKADRTEIISADRDLSFITASVQDDDGNICRGAGNLIKYSIEGPGQIAGLDNGDPTNHESFQGRSHKVFNGLGLIVVQAKNAIGAVQLNANSDGLAGSTISIDVK
jgi:beta-galactosidase